MRWKELSSQKQGNIGLGRAISYFTNNGYVVSIPLNDCQDYDLIVENSGILEKVQVKTTRSIAPSGSYRVSLVSCGGTNGSIYHRVCESDVDILFISTESGDDYLIPNEDLPRKNINLSGKWLKYKVS